MTPTTHAAVAAAAKPASPCAAHHVTFGGRCLNCGWAPAARPVLSPGNSPAVD